MSVREEIEVKIPAPDLGAVRDRLREAGATLYAARHDETNDLYDDAARTLSGSGRTVRLLQNAMMPAGEHTRLWDGTDESAQRVAPGLYFAHLRTAEGVQVQRVAVVR